MCLLTFRKKPICIFTAKERKASTDHTFKKLAEASGRQPPSQQEAQGLRDLRLVIWGHLGFSAREPAAAAQIRPEQNSGSLNNICLV